MPEISGPTGPVSELDRVEEVITIAIPESNFAVAGGLLINNVQYRNQMINVVIEGRSLHYGTSYATITLDNNDGRFLDSNGEFSILAGQAVVISYDYGAGSTIIFRGKAQYPTASFNNGGAVITLPAICLPEAADRRIKIKFDNIGAVAAVKQIIDTYLSSVASYTNFNTNLSSNSFSLSATYDDTINKILSDIFQRAGWDGYWDFDPDATGKHDLVGFAENTALTQPDGVAAVTGQNMVSVQNWGKDYEREYNNVILNGATIGGGRLLKSGRNQALQDTTWRRDKQISDNRILTQSEMDARLTYELGVMQQQRSASLTCAGLPGITPARLMSCVCLPIGMNSTYPVSKYRHTIDQRWLTQCDIVEKQARYPELFQTLTLNQDAITNFDNPNDMAYSVNRNFDSDTDTGNGISTRSAINYVKGIIQISSGSEGFVITSTAILTEDVNYFDYILENPKEFELSRLEVSNDGGNTYVVATASSQKTSIAFPASGRRIRVKVTLVADSGFNVSPSLDGFAVRCKA